MKGQCSALSTNPPSHQGQCRQMHLPLAHGMSCLIWHAGIGSYMYSADMARANQQLSLDPANWPLVCFQFEGRFFIDLSLPFGFRLVASHCQDVPASSRGSWGGRAWHSSTASIPITQVTAAPHFGLLQALLDKFGLHIKICISGRICICK